MGSLLAHIHLRQVIIQVKRKVASVIVYQENLMDRAILTGAKVNTKSKHIRKELEHAMSEIQAWYHDEKAELGKRR